MIERRALLGGLLSALAAPAIVRASSLMPVRATILKPSWKPMVFGIDPASPTEDFAAVVKYEYDKILRTIRVVEWKTVAGWQSLPPAGSGLLRITEQG